MLRGEREVKVPVCICRRRQWSEVAALSEQTPWQRVHVYSSARLIKQSIRHAGRVVERE